MSAYGQKFYDKQNRLVDEPVLGGRIVDLGQDGSELRSIPVEHSTLRDWRASKGRQAQDPYEAPGAPRSPRDTQDQARFNHERLMQRREQRKAEDSALRTEYNATQRTAQDMGYQPVARSTRRSTGLSDNERDNMVAEDQHLRRVIANTANSTQPTDAKEAADWNKQPIIHEGRIVQRGVAAQENAERATRKAAKEKINENRVAAAKQAVKNEENQRRQDGDRMRQIQSATPSAPHALRDKNGNVVGYSYRGQKLPEGTTKEAETAIRKRDAETARNANIDGVKAKDAVAIGSRTNADERFDAQYGTKQAEAGGGSYANRITAQKEHDAKMASFANPASRRAIGQAGAARRAAEKTNETPISAPTPRMTAGMNMPPPGSPTIASNTNTANIRTRVNPSASGSSGTFASIDGRHQSTPRVTTPPNRDSMADRGTPAHTNRITRERNLTPTEDANIKEQYPLGGTRGDGMTPSGRPISGRVVQSRLSPERDRAIKRQYPL